MRVLLYRLEGNGKYEILSHVAKPLKVDGVYDFIGAEATGEEMFDFIAALVDEAVGGDHETPYLLGHTFSFPSAQTNINDARLIIWTKEFAARGVEGEVVNDLLRADGDNQVIQESLADVYFSNGESFDSLQIEQDLLPRFEKYKVWAMEYYDEE